MRASTHSRRLVAGLTALGALALAGGADAAFPGANGPVVFASTHSGNTDIWVMQPDGTGARRLTTDQARDSEPAVSPNGHRIVFTSHRTGNPDVFVMNADGSGQTRLTTSPAADEQPVFSPDGRRIAFASNRSFRTQIHVMSADGSGEAQLTNETWPASDPAFSPNGRQLAFTKTVAGNKEIFVTDRTDGCCSPGIQLTDFAGVDMAPDYSPDGAWIVYVRSWDIYKMRTDGSGQTSLESHPAAHDRPSYSPDGTRIVFESTRDMASGEIYTIRDDGSDLRRLTANTLVDGWPAWSPLPDATPPDPPVLTGTEPPSPANHNAPRVRGEAEPGSTVELYADGSCSGPVTAAGEESAFATEGLAIAVVDDSSTTLSATATDAAGNVSGCSPSPIAYVEDSTAPDSAIDAGPDGPTADRTPVFEFSSTEPGSSFECRVDDAAFAACDSPHTTAPLEDGSHTFEARAIDPAGNADPTAAERRFTVCGGTAPATAVALASLLRPLAPEAAGGVAGALCA